MRNEYNFNITIYSSNKDKHFIKLKISCIACVF